MYVVCSLVFCEWIPLYVVCCILNVFALQTSLEQARRDGWLDKWNKYWEDPAVFERFLENRLEQCGEPTKGQMPPPFDAGVFEESQRQILQHDTERHLQPMDHIAFLVWRTRDRRRSHLHSLSLCCKLWVVMCSRNIIVQEMFVCYCVAFEWLQDRSPSRTRLDSSGGLQGAIPSQQKGLQRAC